MQYTKHERPPAISTRIHLKNQLALQKLAARGTVYHASATSKETVTLELLKPGQLVKE